MWSSLRYVLTERHLVGRRKWLPSANLCHPRPRYCIIEPAPISTHCSTKVSGILCFTSPASPALTQAHAASIRPRPRQSCRIIDEEAFCGENWITVLSGSRRLTFTTSPDESEFVWSRVGVKGDKMHACCPNCTMQLKSCNLSIPAQAQRGRLNSHCKDARPVRLGPGTLLSQVTYHHEFRPAADRWMDCGRV